MDQITILITGGAGFIGSNFVKFLFNKYPQCRLIVLDLLTYAGNLQNFSKSLLDSDRFEFWYGNICNPEIVNPLVDRSDYIVHFAAESHVARSIFDNRIFFETDVLGTQTLCSAILKNPKVKKFIHISTSEVYGTAVEDPMTEEHPLLPMSPYASAKAGADRLVYSYWKTYNIPAIIVRPFNNYGPNQHLEKVIPRFITNALLNEPLKIHGDGTASRDWIFVHDHCEILDTILRSSENLFGQCFNAGSGKDYDLNFIANFILSSLEKSSDLIEYIYDRPGQVTRHIASTEKVFKQWSWKAKTPFKEGLQKTIKWYAANREWWEPLRWMREVPIKLPDGKVILH